MEQKRNSMSIQLVKSLYSAIPDLNIQWQFLQQLFRTIDATNFWETKVQNNRDQYFKQLNNEESLLQRKQGVYLNIQLPIETIKEIMTIRSFFKQCLYRNSQLIRSQKKSLKFNQTKASLNYQKSNDYAKLSEQLIMEKINERQANKIKFRKKTSQVQLCMTSNNFNDKFRNKKSQKFDYRATQSRFFANFRAAGHTISSLEKINKQASLVPALKYKPQNNYQPKTKLKKIQKSLMCNDKQAQQDQEQSKDFVQLDQKRKHIGLSFQEPKFQVYSQTQINTAIVANLSLSEKIAVLLNKNSIKVVQHDQKQYNTQKKTERAQNNMAILQNVDTNMISNRKFFDFMPKRQYFKGYKKVNAKQQRSKGADSPSLRNNRNFQQFSNQQNNNSVQKAENQYQQIFKKPLLGCFKIGNRKQQSQSLSIINYTKKSCEKGQITVNDSSNVKKQSFSLLANQNNLNGIYSGKAWKKMRRYGNNSSTNFKKDEQQPLRTLSSNQIKDNIIVIKSLQNKFNWSEKLFKGQSKAQKIKPIFQKNVSSYVKRTSDKKSRIHNQMIKHLSVKRNQQPIEQRSQCIQSSCKKRQFFQNYAMQ